MRKSLNDKHILSDLFPTLAAAHHCNSSAPHVIISTLDVWAAHETWSADNFQNPTS